MNKTELVAALAEKTQLPKKNAELALNAVVEVITESLSKGDKVQIVGFGSFEVKDRPSPAKRRTPSPPAIRRSPKKRLPSRLPRRLFSRLASPSRTLSISNRP